MIGNIEQAIVDVITEAVKSKQLGYDIERIAGYKGEFEHLDELLGSKRTAVLVAFNGKTKKREFDFCTEFEASFLVEVYSRNSTRNEKDSRFGVKGTVGAYQMAEDVENLLDNNKLNLLSEPLSLERVTPVFSGQVESFHAAAYELEFKCTYTKTRYTPDGDLDKLGRFETLKTSWDLPDPAAELIIKLPQTKE